MIDFFPNNNAWHRWCSCSRQPFPTRHLVQCGVFVKPSNLLVHQMHKQTRSDSNWWLDASQIFKHCDGMCLYSTHMSATVTENHRAPFLSKLELHRYEIRVPDYLKICPQIIFQAKWATVFQFKGGSTHRYLCHGICGPVTGPGLGDIPAASIGTATYSCARFADPNGRERGSQSLKAARLANSYRPLECLKGLFFSSTTWMNLLIVMF